MIFTATMLPESSSYLIIMGYRRGFLIPEVNIIEGRSLTTNHQVLLGGASPMREQR
jgi:hypothetical protein